MRLERDKEVLGRAPSPPSSMRECYATGQVAQPVLGHILWLGRRVLACTANQADAGPHLDWADCNQLVRQLVM